jgi:hypothetical protein
MDENRGRILFSTGFNKVSCSAHIKVVITLSIETLLSGYKMIDNVRTGGGVCKGISLKDIPLCEGNV